ncbi:MAG TPA: universal stress protein [Polyangia bacterium]|jgi:nucleotide-binding universal stress UspA family protein|nr:universal stress protein [Polyangia bacterium]
MVKRILIPMDFSESSTAAVEVAISYARAFKASIQLLHVLADPTYVLPAPLEVVTLPIDMERINAEVEKRMASEVERIRALDVSCESATLMGRPHTEIVEHAKKIGADLIAMGTHGRSGLSHAIMGSVAERVLHRAPCPVLVVPIRR